jgi:hypothetical protein
VTHDDELILATIKARDRQLAEMMCVTIGLAAELYPDILRTALAKVFDLSAVEDMAKRVIAIATDAQQQAIQARELLVQVTADIEEMEKRIDRLMDAMRTVYRKLPKTESTNGRK